MNKLTAQLSKVDRFHLGLQRTIAYLIFPIMYALMLLVNLCYLRYRIRNLKNIRRQYQTILAKERQPLLICANHLTYVDPFMLVLGLFSPWFAYRRFKAVPWNLPKAKHARKNWLNSIICYIGKTIPLPEVTDQAKSQQALAKFQYVLSQGDSLMLFPEGRRSHNGKIDQQNFGYGVGQILLQQPQSKVLCCYIRQQDDDDHRGFPKRGSSFNIDLKVITVTSEQQGLRAVRDLSRQVMQCLISMEQTYFDQAT